MKRILIIEDDKKLNDGIRLALRKDYSCAQAFSLQSARRDFIVQQFDLVILDVNFPDGSGLDYLDELRRVCQVPVILLTANSMEMDPRKLRIFHFCCQYNLLYRLIHVKGAELYAGALALVLGAAFCFLTLKYMRTSDEV